MRTRKFTFEIYWPSINCWASYNSPKTNYSSCNLSYGPNCSFNLFLNFRIPNLYYLDWILGKNQSSSKRCGWGLSSWKYARNQHCFTGRAQTWKITNHCQGYFWKVPVNLLQSDVENKGQKFWDIKGNSNQEIVRNNLVFFDKSKNWNWNMNYIWNFSVLPQCTMGRLSK